MTKYINYCVIRYDKNLTVVLCSVAEIPSSLMESTTALNSKTTTRNEITRLLLQYTIFQKNRHIPVPE